jgi:hypothetical protein
MTIPPVSQGSDTNTDTVGSGDERRRDLGSTLLDLYDIEPTVGVGSPSTAHEEVGPSTVPSTNVG